MTETLKTHDISTKLCWSELPQAQLDPNEKDTGILLWTGEPEKQNKATSRAEVDSDTENI